MKKNLEVSGRWTRLSRFRPDFGTYRSSQMNWCRLIINEGKTGIKSRADVYTHSMSKLLQADFTRNRPGLCCWHYWSKCC